MTRKSKDHIDLWVEHGIDIPGKTVYLTGEVDSDMLDRATTAFHLFGKNADVDVILNSCGGDTWDGFAIYDILKGHGGRVTVTIVGQASSMACVILQAGDVRRASQNSILMHHAGSIQYPENHAKNIQLLAAFTEKHNARIDNIMLSRINEKRKVDELAPRAMSWWKERDLWDRYMFPEEAIDLGLLDEIAE